MTILSYTKGENLESTKRYGPTIMDLLGMFIAWVVLTGSAKTVVGYAIIGTLIIWAVTYHLRNPKDE